jgi:hypothetical protein
MGRRTCLNRFRYMGSLVLMIGDRRMRYVGISVLRHMSKVRRTTSSVAVAVGAVAFPGTNSLPGIYIRAKWSAEAKEQVPESGHSLWIMGRAHVPFLVERAESEIRRRRTNQHGWCRHSARADSRNAGRQGCQPPSTRLSREPRQPGLGRILVV